LLNGWPGELQAGRVDYGWQAQASLPAAVYTEEETVPVSVALNAGSLGQH